jgi:FkbM family methyltransferase
LAVSDDAPFGAHAPGALARAARALAAGTGAAPGAALVRSALFTLMGGRARRPRDVAVFASERARLHPYDNLAEKRVYRSEAHWDAVERAFIAARARAGEGPFTFVDVGANAGLYTLAARAAAKQAGRPFRGVAIEPQPVMLARLRFNLAASGAADEVTVLPWAAAAEAGQLNLAVPARNRGAAKPGAEGVAVPARPLADALETAGLAHLDVLKIDIEGQEGPVLAAFFAAVPVRLWPRAIVIEAGAHGEDRAGPARCRDAGYELFERTGMNALLVRDRAAAS